MIKMRIIYLCLILMSGGTMNAQFPGHAHNDYQHDQPLQQAFELGYRSIEVDVFLNKDQEAVVSHVSLFLKSKPKFSELYVFPLLQMLKSEKLDKKKPILLLIDLKGKEKSKLIGAVHQALMPVMDDIQRVGEDDQRPLKIVLSGNPPRTSLPFYKEDIFFIDGDIGDLSSTEYKERIAGVSFNFKDVFDWNGKGEMPGIQKIKLEEMVKKAHEQDKTIRMWNAPQTEPFYKTVLNAGVDWVNIDDIEFFKSFWQQFEPEN